MNQISEFFIRNPKLTLVLMGAVMLIGLKALWGLKAESFPQVDFAIATITTSYDGASAEDIEAKITKPLEDEIKKVSGVKDVRSVSQAGLSTITIRGDIDNVVVTELMSDLQKAIDRVSTLPNDLRDQPLFTEIKSEEFPVLELAIVGSNEGRKRDLVADALKENIEDIKTVHSVRLSGFGKRRFQIRIDQEKLLAYHISIDEIERKIAERNLNIPGGNLRSRAKGEQTLLRLEGKIKDTKELQNILIRSNFSGQKIYLKDLAMVEDSIEERKILTRYNGKNATFLTVSKKGGADTIELVRRIDTVLKSAKESYGSELDFFIYHNESTKVQAKLDVLSSNAVSGLILVIVFLFIFLPGAVGVMASISLPLAVLGTLGLMPLLGANLDAISILALIIALGMLVDNSVVITENFVRLKSEGMNSHEAAVVSIRQLWVPITATALTTIAAFLPMLVTKGIMGRFIRFIPMIVSTSLILSLLESFFFLPLRLVSVGRFVRPPKNVSRFERFQQKFEKLMGLVLRQRYPLLFLYILIVGFSLFLMSPPRNKFILFPPEQTENYLARVEVATGARVERTSAILANLSQKIKEVLGEDALHITARAGVAQLGPNDPKAKEGNSVGMILIKVSDRMRNDVSHTEVLRKLRTISLPELKELSFEAQVNGPPVGDPIEATLRANSFSEIDTFGAKIIEELEKVAGIYDLKLIEQIGDDEIFINIDYEKAERLGLGVKAIGETVRSSVSGKQVSTVTLDNKDVEIMARLRPSDKENLQDLEKILIRDQRENLVPLSKIASFTRSKGAPIIQRYDFKRAKTLSGNVDDSQGMTSAAANRKLKEIFDRHQKDFPGVSLVFGGAAESSNESLSSLFDALQISLIGIFALLVFIFNSFMRPFIIMLTIPLGLFGLSVSFYLHQRPISFLSLIGVIGLGGIIVNSGIVLISFIDQMRAEGKLSFEEILVKASGMRLRAVIVTSLTTISGLLPTAYGIGGSDSLLIPMTMAMAWGLTSGTIFTLIWIPPLYAISEDLSGLMTKAITLFRGKLAPKTNTNCPY